MDRVSSLVEHRRLDPRVVVVEARRPDHDLGLDAAVIGDPERATLGAHDPSKQLDSMTPGELLVARSDQQVAAALATPKAPDRRGHEAEVIAPPVEALAEDAAREPRRF